MNGNDAAHSASLANVKRYEDAAPADLAADSTYLLPGVIDKDITLDNLRRRFGAANVQVADIDASEGEKAKGVILFAKDPMRRAEIFLRDEARLRGIDRVRVWGNKSRWHLDNGLQLGMKLEALAAANGKPVSFHGLDWDYGGMVVDWHGGKFEQRKGDEVLRPISLTHAEGAMGFPLGEDTYRSDDLHFPKQLRALYIGEINVTFPNSDDK